MPHPDAPIALLPLTETAHAKVNLALHVRARRADGYHELESLFAFAEDGDVLHAAPGNDLTLEIEGPFAGALTGNDDNLVLKAARMLREATDVDVGARMRLDKRLPVASGIGGGSADAAAALRLLMRLWGVAVPAERLHTLALALGSDVPACLASRTQFVGGRGEALNLVTLDGLDGALLLLANPGVPLSTGPVFAGWDRVDRGPLAAHDLGHARNDLEAPAIALAPQIADVLAALRGQAGVGLSRMSGSGATCFALFDEARTMAAAAAALRAAHPDWWVMETRIRA